MSTELTLADAHARARTHLVAAGGPPAAHEQDAFSGAEELADWLRECAAKVRREESVLPSMEGSPDTLYLWLNDVSFNLDRWSLAPMAFSWEGRSEDVGVSEMFDRVVGHEAGDLKADYFTLTGMEPLQEAMAGADDPEAPGRFVVASAMLLVDHALRRAGAIGVRVALSQSDEPLIALWTHDGNAWTATLHADDSVWV